MWIPARLEDELIVSRCSYLVFPLPRGERIEVRGREH